MGYFVWKGNHIPRKKRHFQSIPIETVCAVRVNVLSELIVYCSVQPMRENLLMASAYARTSVRTDCRDRGRWTKGKVRESYTYLAFVSVKGKPPYSPVKIVKFLVFELDNRPIWLTRCCTQFEPIGNKTFCFKNFHII